MDDRPANVELLCNETRSWFVRGNQTPIIHGLSTPYLLAEL